MWTIVVPIVDRLVWLIFQNGSFYTNHYWNGFVLLTYFFSQTLAVGLMLTGSTLSFASKAAPSIQELKAFDFRELTKLPAVMMW